MIKPINITPLNTTQELHYECGKCKAKGIIKLEGSIIDTDNYGNSTIPLGDFDCPQCNEKL